MAAAEAAAAAPVLAMEVLAGAGPAAAAATAPAGTPEAPPTAEGGAEQTQVPVATTSGATVGLHAIVAARTYADAPVQTEATDTIPGFPSPSAYLNRRHPARPRRHLRGACGGLGSDRLLLRVLRPVPGSVRRYLYRRGCLRPGVASFVRPRRGVGEVGR